MKKLTLSFLLLAVMVFAPLVFTPGAQAALFSGAKDNACQGIGQGTNGCSDTAGSQVENIIKNSLNVLSIIVGIVAVIMVIVAGFKYETSGGDSSKISSAKSTLIYALVGLVVVALAQFIVQFVINSTSAPKKKAESIVYMV